MMKKIIFSMSLVAILAMAANARHAQADILDGLIAYWPLDNDLLDATGNGYNGFIQRGGSETFVPAVVGNGINLPGPPNAGPWISIGRDGNAPNTGDDADDTFDFVGGTAWSTSTWFRVDGFETNWQALLIKGEGSGWRFHRRGSENNLAVHLGTGDNSIGNVNDGQFHHLLTTNDPSGERFAYLDGVQMNLGAGFQVQNRNNPLAIGNNADSHNRAWHGIIDDVGIWDRALSADEAAQVYNNGAGINLIIPEPTSAVLALIGLLGLGAFGRRRRQRS